MSWEKEEWTLKKIMMNISSFLSEIATKWSQNLWILSDQGNVVLILIYKILTKFYKRV